MKTSLQQSLLSRAPQIFLLCCELRNFSYAARSLGLTQSAVSKAIQNFENELGFTLFIRNCRPLTLTAEAAELEQFLRHVSGDFSQFLTRIQSRSFIKPVLRVGMEASLAPSGSSWIPTPRPFPSPAKAWDGPSCSPRRCSR